MNIAINAVESAYKKSNNKGNVWPLVFNDYDQLVVAYMGFDLIVNNVPKISDIIRAKFNEDNDYSQLRL